MSNQNSLVSFNRYIMNQKTNDYLNEVLGEKKEDFVSNLVSLVANNVALQDCTPNSIMYAAMKATAMGLPLDANLGCAYVLPYNNTKTNTKEAQFQMGYKGFVQLAMRSGQFLTIHTGDVKEGELVTTDRLTGISSFNWITDEKRLKAKTVGFVAYFELITGFKKSLYMTVEELQAHGKKYSKSYNQSYGNWKKRFDAMASKTVLKMLLSKYAPLSVQMQEAVKYDQAVIRGADDAQYIDSGEATTDSDKEELDRIESFILEAKTLKELNAITVKMTNEQMEILLPIVDAQRINLKPKS